MTSAFAAYQTSCSSHKEPNLPMMRRDRAIDGQTFTCLYNDLLEVVGLVAAYIFDSSRSCCVL